MLDFDEKSNMHRCMRDSNSGWAYAWRRVRDPLPDIFAPTRSSSSGDPSGMSTRRRKDYQKKISTKGCTDGGWVVGIDHTAKP